MKSSTSTADKVFDEKTFQHQLRPAWTPVNIALMILFFVASLWPLGLLMIAYMMYGKEMGIDLSNWGSAKSSAKKASRGFSWSSNRTQSSGNAAFDAWREEEMERIRKEREKLEEAKEAFEQHMKDLRMARDREEFENFRRQWSNGGEASSPGGNPGYGA